MRRQILEHLARQPRAVGELVRELPISQPAVSQHLRVLRAAGLVSARAQGTRRIYRADPSGLSRIRAYVETLWADALSSFAEYIQAEGEVK